MTLVQSPANIHATGSQALEAPGQTYRFIPRHQVEVTPEDAAFIVANIQGWTLAAPAESEV